MGWTRLRHQDVIATNLSPLTRNLPCFCRTSSTSKNKTGRKKMKKKRRKEAERKCQTALRRKFFSRSIVDRRLCAHTTLSRLRKCVYQLVIQHTQALTRHDTHPYLSFCTSSTRRLYREREKRERERATNKKRKDKKKEK